MARHPDLWFVEGAEVNFVHVRKIDARLPKAYHVLHNVPVALKSVAVGSGGHGPLHGEERVATQSFVMAAAAAEIPIEGGSWRCVR